MHQLGPYQAVSILAPKTDVRFGRHIQTQHTHILHVQQQTIVQINRLVLVTCESVQVEYLGENGRRTPNIPAKVLTFSLTEDYTTLYSSLPH